MAATRSAPRFEACVNTKQSSANKRWEIHGACLLTLTPRETYKGPIFFSIHESPSAHSRNKYGEIGSPCGMPHVGLKLSKKIPLTLTENETDETHFMIRAH